MNTLQLELILAFPRKECGVSKGGEGCRGPRGCRRMRFGLGMKMEDQEEEKGEIHQAGKL